MKKYVIILTFFIVACNTLFAIPAYPYPVVFTQPNGDTLTIVMAGDEFLKFATSEDGYTLMYDHNGFFCYALQNRNGDIEPSHYIAKSKNERNAEELLFLQTVQRGLFYSNSQLNILSQIREMRAIESSPERAFPTTGERKLICILIGFTDRVFVRTNAEFVNLFNQINYNFQNANGSVKEYFSEASYNQLDLTVDVVGPFTASGNMAYYGANDGSGNDIRPRELIAEACTLAYNAGTDFSLYDNDGDGWVDGIYVIYAGYDESAGGGDNCIWAHAWYLVNPIQLNGVWIHRYSCSSELRSNIGSNITYIGVICHEFGHVLGAPDYYDTNYAVGGQYQGTGNWDLQAGGSWNDNGRTPPHPNPRTKVYTYNWATVTELNTPQIVQIPPSIDDNTAFYRINTETANEYFIIENRQRKMFDTYLPGQGLMIYRCHSQITGSESSNTVNATHPQLFYPVAANAPEQIPIAMSSSYGTINSNSCSWPGTLNKTQFTDATTPAMRSWDNVNTNKPITNIYEESATGVVTFSFLGGAGYVIQATAGNGGSITPAGIIVVEQGNSYTFTFTPDEGNVIDYVLIDNALNHEAISNGFYTFSNVAENHTVHVTFGCPQQNLPLTESFNNTLFPPNCWNNTSSGGTTWKRATLGTNPTCYPRSGEGMIHYDCWNYAPGATGLLVTPKIATNDQNMVLSFWIYRDNFGNYGDRNDRVNVYLSTTYSISGLIPVFTVFRCSDYEPAETSEGWYQYTIELSSANLSSAYIILEGVSNYGNNIYLDDIVIIQDGATLECSPATHLIVNYTTDCKAELSWDAPASSGEDMLYNIYRDNLLILSEITETSYVDTDINHSTGHTWSVTAVCFYGESEPVSLTKGECIVTNRLRTILLEGFTASTSLDCATGNMALTNLLNQNQGQYALINYPCNFPATGDPYYTEEGGIRRTYYGIIGVPHLQCEGSALSIHPESLTNNQLENLQNIPAFIELGIDYYVSDKTVFAKATLNPTADFSDPDLRLYMAIVEKTTTQNATSNGETEFTQVMKKFIPDENGIPVGNLTAFSPVEFEQVWEFKGNYRLPANAFYPINHDIEHSIEDFSNLSIVAWIQSTQNKTVLQACNATLIALPPPAFTFFNNENPFPNNEEITITDVEYEGGLLLMKSEIFLNNITSNNIPASLTQIVLEPPSAGTLEVCFGGTCFAPTNGNETWQGTITPGLHNDPNEFKLIFYPAEGTSSSVKVKYEIYPHNNPGDKTTVTINYVYIAPEYTITATAGDNGTITPSGNQTINHGDNIEFTIEPNSGYYVAEVLVDAEPVLTIPEEGGVYTFTNVTANHTIDVSFAINIYTITATSGDNGTITPSGTQTINHGGNIEFTIMPENGYHVEDVLVDDEPVLTIPEEGSVYTFMNVTANHTIDATFAINTYTITATAGENGTITPSGNQTINHGDNIEFTITPENGYYLAEVLVDEEPVTTIPEEGGVYTFTNVTANYTIDVSFVEKEEIDENLLSHVKVYSHKNTVYIKNETELALKSVEIMDMLGRTIYGGVIIVQETVISLQVATGIYTVKLISTNEQTFISKVAIMR